MVTVKTAVVLAAGSTLFLLPVNADARSSYGFSFSTGGPVFAPAPVYVAPPPPPPVVYRPYYPVYAAPYFRPGPSFSFSYHGH